MSDLFMLRYVISDSALARFLHVHHFLTRNGHEALPQDRGYQLHAYLTAAVGVTPRPFSDEGSHNGMTTVLAYATSIPTAQDPAWPVTIDHKLVPASALAVGTTLGFQVRCMPMLRTRTPRTAASPADSSWQALTAVAGGAPAIDAAGVSTERRSREVDAYTHAQDAGDARSREDVYQAWLAVQVQPHGLTLGACALHQFQVTALLRRTQLAAGAPRSGRRIMRPDAVITGRLQVTDTTACRAFLARGVGRHLAFGFGMLKLRPAS